MQGGAVGYNGAGEAWFGHPSDQAALLLVINSVIELQRHRSSYHNTRLDQLMFTYYANAKIVLETRNLT